MRASGAYELAALILAIREHEGPSLVHTPPLLSDIAHTVHIYEEQYRDHTEVVEITASHHVRWG